MDVGHQPPLPLYNDFVRSYPLIGVARRVIEYPKTLEREPVPMLERHVLDPRTFSVSRGERIQPVKMIRKFLAVSLLAGNK